MKKALGVGNVKLTSSPKILTVAVTLVLGLGGYAHAGLIFTNTHHYDQGTNIDAVDIKVEVFDNVGSYLWQYTVTNNLFDPIPGTSNGFSGFELALPAAVPDIGNVTKPNASWEVDCCSGAPVEWDITNSGGLGIMPPDGTGVFSFTTLPRFITTSTGWFHTWESDVQTDVTLYSFTPGETGPEVPDVLRPPIPEPASAGLLGAALASLWLIRRRKKA